MKFELMVFLNTKIFSSLLVVNTAYLQCYMAGVCKSATLSGLVQINIQQTFIFLPLLSTTETRSSIFISPFSHRGITSPRRALATCPAFSSPGSLGFLFLLWCLSLSLPEGLFSFSMRWCFPSLNVLALTSSVAPAWVSFMAKPHERLQALLSFSVTALNLTY